MSALKLKITRIGNSSGVVLPKEAMARLKIEEGDTIYLTEAPGGYRIVNYDPDFEATMEAARKVMRKRRTLLRALAK